MTGVFTGTLAIVLGLGFWLGLLAMVIGTVLGSLVVGYLSTWGPRTGTAPAAQLADGVRRRRRAARCAAMAVVDRVGRAWSGCSVGRRCRCCSASRSGLAVLIVLALQGAVGLLRLRAHPPDAGGADRRAVRDVRGVRRQARRRDMRSSPRPPCTGADLVGAFVLEVTIAFSLAMSWASYAADFSRYLPADFLAGTGVRLHASPESSWRTSSFRASVSPRADVLSEQTAEGVRSVMGGGVLGGLALLVIALASIGSGAMNDYSGSLALQTIGVRVRRPVSAVVVTVLAFPLITVAARRRHRDPVPGCAAAGRLLDPGVRRGRRHRLAAADPGPRAASTPPRSRPTAATRWPR